MVLKILRKFLPLIIYYERSFKLENKTDKKALNKITSDKVNFAKVDYFKSSSISL